MLVTIAFFLFIKPGAKWQSPCPRDGNNDWPCLTTYSELKYWAYPKPWMWSDSDVRLSLQREYDSLEAQIEATADPVLSAKLQAQQKAYADAIQGGNDVTLAVVSGLDK